MIKTKLFKCMAIIMGIPIVSAISMGCSNTYMPKQEQTIIAELTEETKIDISSIEESSTETAMEETISDNAHNIFEGTIGELEIVMNISREGNSLTAKYITRTDDEKIFFGEMLSPTQFELNDNEGGYLKGTIDDVYLKGTGNIFGKDLVFTMHLTTLFSIGYDYDDYYSGVFNKSGDMTSTEVENFAQQIKEYVTNKEKFIKLFRYPLDIRVNGEVISVQNENEMSEKYDTLLVEKDFREQIETMYTKYLFVNYQGVCVENGILWFSKDDNGDFKISSINYHR